MSSQRIPHETAKGALTSSSILSVAYGYRSLIPTLVFLLLVGFLAGKLVGSSKVVAIIVAFAATFGVGVYFYRFEREKWPVNLYLFILFEIIVAGFVFDVCFH